MEKGSRNGGACKRFRRSNIGRKRQADSKNYCIKAPKKTAKKPNCIVTHLSDRSPVPF